MTVFAPLSSSPSQAFFTVSSSGDTDLEVMDADVDTVRREVYALLITNTTANAPM
jgi:hypothetical protein